MRDKTFYNHIRTKMFDIVNHQINIFVCGHIILGLPGETSDAMVAQAGILSDLPLSTLKIHQLQLIRGTRMAHEYDINPADFHLFSEVNELSQVLSIPYSTIRKACLFNSSR